MNTQMFIIVLIASLASIAGVIYMLATLDGVGLLSTLFAVIAVGCSDSVIYKRKLYP